MAWRVLAAIGMAAVISWAGAVPASAGGQGGTGPVPRADEWWFATWNVVSGVWPLSQGAGVTVAVLDSGTQASIPDLRGVVLPGGDVTGSGTDGEHDFATSGDGHGTEMAALIAGQGPGTGIVGIAPRARILPVVVNAGAVDRTADPGRVAAGIRYAAAHGAGVIDVSQVYPSGSAYGCDAAEQAAVAYALSRGIVVVAAEASSNLIGTAPSEPASCAGVLAVGSVQRDRWLWPGDVPEPYLAVVAPGAGLVSSGRDGRLVPNWSGTRSAAALVAGVAALIRSRYPAMPWYQVVQRIIGTALPEGGQVPNDSYGYGIVRLSEAVNATAFPVPASAPDPVYARYLAWQKTPQGRALSPRAATKPARQRRPAGAGTTATPASGATAAWAVPGSALLLAALVLVLAVMGRRPKGRRRATGAARGMTAAGGLAPGPEPVAPSGAELRSRVIVADDDPVAEITPRIPPYMPPHHPKAGSPGNPPAPGGDFRFPTVEPTPSR